VDTQNVKKILNPQITFRGETVKKSIENGDRIEISPKSLVLMNSFAELISKIGGGVLAIDYGDTFSFSDSIRVNSPSSRE
jgi:SAM-dependent MidA family methyltransferase